LRAKYALQQDCIRLVALGIQASASPGPNSIEYIAAFLAF
jgi:hypothetical protein